MRVDIDPKSPHPPSEQIADQIRFAVASKRLASGDRLPSVRSLASDALVNPNTVARAYRQLEHEGVVETRPGDGVFVTARAHERCASHRDREVLRRLRRAIDEAISAGLEPWELLRWVEKALERHKTKAGGSR